eukprot:767755-Hanusia_phi.AAC.2
MPGDNRLLSAVGLCATLVSLAFAGSLARPGAAGARPGAAAAGHHGHPSGDSGSSACGQLVPYPAPFPACGARRAAGQ